MSKDFLWKGYIMYSKTLSAFVKDTTIDVISVECDISNGLPVFDMVGLLGSEVREAKERVCTALKNSEIYMPAKRITVNLSPANLRKKGNLYDLPIAIALLSAMNFVEKEKIQSVMIVGELGLDGRIVGVNGVLPIVYEGKKMGIHKFLIPIENIEEGNLVEGVMVAGASSVMEALEIINKNKFYKSKGLEKYCGDMSRENNQKDFFDVKGQESVKRAVMIGAAGMHNILMIGPPGTGKSMIAERIPYIMPAPGQEECMEITKIASITRNVRLKGLVTERPFVAPHHTITRTALVGGGATAKAGEITKAHRGVLFLDELAEFRGETLDTLRQPLEKGEVVINRNNGNYVFPAEVMLVAATNPCKCGYYPDRNKCICSENDVNRYMGKISGPMLERMDITIYVPQVKLWEGDKRKCMSSVEMREKIEKAILRQRDRYKYMKKTIFNGKLHCKEVEKYCVLGKTEKDYLKEVCSKIEISGRGYYKILKVARTIADIEDTEDINIAHLAEAISYKNDRRR